jgi:hypothetical protein
MIRRIKMRQQSTMRIRPPCPHKNSLHSRLLLQVFPKSLFHGHGIAGQIKTVCGDRLIHEVVYFGERVLGDDIDGL